MTRKRAHLIPRSIDPIRRMRVVGRLVRRVVKKPGSAPGIVVHTGQRKVEKVRIRFLDYDEQQLNDAERPTIDECLTLKDLPTVSWINVDGLHEVDLIRRLGERFGWHPLVMEDIASTGQRAKMEEYDDYVYVVLPMLSWNPEGGHVEHEQLSLVLGPNYVVTFQERYGDVFESVRERIRSTGTRIRTRGPDYLAYALIDAVVDHYFQVLETIGDHTERLEEQVLAEPREEIMHELHHVKRELITVRRAIWPLREMLSSLQRSETTLFTDQTRVFTRDVHDHAVQVLDTMEALRDVVGGMIDLYLSSVSFRTNEIMKVLTIMASIFIPLTFLAGIYGMNFDNMPELHVSWAYPALVGIMAVVGGGMVLYFRRKGWL
jgi:magnesium transporter